MSSLPAESARQLAEFGLIWVSGDSRWVKTHHEAVITDMVNIRIDGYHVHIVQANMDAQTWLTNPVEVSWLRVVSHIIRRLQVLGQMQIFGEDIFWCFNS